jgi:hypothetical protein
VLTEVESKVEDGTMSTGEGVDILLDKYTPEIK